MPTISDLFARDPLNLSRDDIEAMISYYIDARKQFKLGNASAGATKKLDKIDLQALLGGKVGRS